VVGVEPPLYSPPRLLLDDGAPLPAEDHEGMRAAGQKSPIPCHVDLTAGDV
jgi:hypothetical protein